MSDAFEVRVPMVNPNEPEAVLVEIHVREEQAVKSGDLLCALETTKSVNEVVAEREGFVIGLRRQAGQTVKAGDLFCYLAASVSWKPPAVEAAPESSQAALPADLRITQKARKLAEEQGVDLALLPTGVLVTEAVVHEWLSAESAERPAIDPTAIAVYGGGGHGKSLIDLLRALGTYRVVGVVDDGLTTGGTILGAPTLGGAAALARLRAEGIGQAANAVGGIGNITVRLAVFDRLRQAGFTCPTLVHPTAFVEPSATLDEGVQVMPHAYVGSDAKVGFGVVVNTSAVVSHDCVLGRHSNVAPNAALAGGVTLGDGVLVGMGVTINLGVKVGARARIGNGATVKQDVPEGGVVRAGAVWPPPRPA